jgi:uncharacterized protein
MVGTSLRDVRDIPVRTQTISRTPRCVPTFAIALCFIALASPTAVHAAEVIPSKPDRYFNDYAAVVSKDVGNRFNEELAQFERDTSNQVVVAVFPKMQSDSSIDDYTRRVAQSWGVGQKDRRNGAVLFVFVTDRKMFIQVGYGLEGAIPDITAFDIIENRIKPRFRANDYAGGLAAGIRSIMEAARGEYTGTGKTVNDRRGHDIPFPFLFIVIFIIIAILAARRQRRRGYAYSSFGGPFIGGWSGSGGGWSSGGGSSGFSGGGGSFGGGGAGSSW